MQQCPGEVLRRLVAEGVQVCAAARMPAKAAPLEQAGIATVALDLDRPDTWLPALDGIEQVFFVGYAGPRLPRPRAPWPRRPGGPGPGGW